MPRCEPGHIELNFMFISIFDYAIKVVVVALVVLGLMTLAIVLSGVDMASADEHEIFQYRMVAAPVIIVGYLLLDYLWNRHRMRLAAVARSMDEDPPRRGYGAVLVSLVLVLAGGAAFWHDHITHEIPNAVPVAAKFVSAACVDRAKRSGPHMSIGYEFPSRSTRVRPSMAECFVDKCESQTPPAQTMDTEHKRVFYSSLQECEAALPAVLASRAPATIWTGDKDPNAAVRARFTPERDPPPYFLLWVPAAVFVALLLFSIAQRTRRPQGD